MTISEQYAAELGRQVDELEAENEKLRANVRLALELFVGTICEGPGEDPQGHAWLKEAIELAKRPVLFEPQEMTWDSIVEHVNSLRDRGYWVHVDDYREAEGVKYGEMQVRVSFYLKPEAARK